MVIAKTNRCYVPERGYVETGAPDPDVSPTLPHDTPPAPLESYSDGLLD